MPKNGILVFFIGVGVLALIGAVLGLVVSSSSDSDADETASRPATQDKTGKTSGPESTDADSVVRRAETGNVQDHVAALIADSKAIDRSPEAVEVTRDPNYAQALSAARLFVGEWQTDFSLHTVPYSEILSGGVPRDGIPPIDFPKFESIDGTDRWLKDPEPVVVFELNGDARAYPLRILTSHEIVNDVVGGVPVVVTFCPLCNTAIVFERTLDGVVYDFGVSGKLRKSDLIMWDRQTQSWWQQITGEGIVGDLAGRQLTFLNASIISWEDFKAANPYGVALSRDTGFNRSYARTPYAGYDRADNPPFLYDGVVDGRLLPKERVAAVTIGDVDAAFPFSVLEEEGAVNFTVNGQDLAVFFKPGALSVFDNRRTGAPDKVGATGVFDPNVDGRALTFRMEGDNFVDNETGSVWNILGEATEGPMAGKMLSPIVHANHFWFAWGAFKPDTLIYQGAATAEARSSADEA